MVIYNQSFKNYKTYTYTFSYTCTCTDTSSYRTRIVIVSSAYRNRIVIYNNRYISFIGNPTIGNIVEKQPSLPEALISLFIS